MYIQPCGNVLEMPLFHNETSSKTQGNTGKRMEGRLLQTYLQSCFACLPACLPAFYNTWCVLLIPQPVRNCWSRSSSKATTTKKNLCPPLSVLLSGGQTVDPLSVRSIGPDHSSQLGLPLVTVGQELLCICCQHVVTRLQQPSLLPDMKTHPCYTTTPPSSPSHTRRWDSPQSHQQDSSPGRTRSKCTWSCRYRSAWSFCCHRHAPRPQW